MATILTSGETMALLTSASPGRLRHATRLHLSVGGAESTVAIALSRLGVDAKWISRLGDDELGRLVLNRIRGEGVDTRSVVLDPHRPTGLYLKEQAPVGTRAHYYRRGSAASALAPHAFDPVLLDGVEAIHLTGITAALSASGADYVAWAAGEARRRGVQVSFDINFRAALWSADAARTYIEKILPLVDILFVSEEEAAALWPQHDAASLLARFAAAGPAQILFKRGASGCLAHIDGRFLHHTGYRVTAIEATGAGDAFAAGYLAACSWGQAPQRRLCSANALGAFNVMGYGDYETLPSRQELDGFLAARSHPVP